jgi:hypothetical protein
VTLAEGVLNRLAGRLAELLQQAEVGFCVRVDHLATDEAERVCAALRDRVAGDGVEAFVLGDGAVTSWVSPERAVEIRNRKSTRLCLLVPTGTNPAQASSLANAFAVFEWEQFWRNLLEELLGELPTEIGRFARSALQAARGHIGASIEQRVDYLAALAETATPERAGEELWRLGLIPDLGTEFISRLDDNRRCARELVRPARAQTSPAERVEACLLKPGAVKDEIIAFVSGRRLRNAPTWLCQFVQPPQRGRITFERWVFEAAEGPDLEGIEVEPFLDGEGSVDPSTGLRQPGGPGSPIYAPVTPGGKVTVKWQSVPQRPLSAKNWRAELIPSREEYGEGHSGTEELPSTRTNARTRRAAIKLASLVDVELTIRAVQVRVVALDERGLELRSPDGAVVEGLSQEFWLDTQSEAPVDTEPGPRREAVPNLPFGRLKTSLELNADRIEETGGQWQEKELHYYALSLNGRRVVRVGLSPVLRAVEKRLLEDGDRIGGCFGRVTAGTVLDPERGLEVRELGHLRGHEGGKKFLEARRAVFREIRRQRDRGLVETALWASELSSLARSYTRAWLDLLAAAAPEDVIATALQIDTLTLGIVREGRESPAVLVAPTHPLRLLWYAAYAELLQAWEQELLRQPRKQRSGALDSDLLARVSPTNCPVFVEGPGQELFLFTQNLRFFWGVALPVTTRDPGRTVAEIAACVGLSAEEIDLVDLPPARIAAELSSYRDVHPYLENLRLNVLNPGAGAFVAESLRSFYEMEAAEDDAEAATPPPRVEVLAHCEPPLPLRLGPLEELQRELYEAQPPGRRQHLAPFFALALRPMTAADSLSGGDVNLSLVVDLVRPRIGEVQPDLGTPSPSFYGLLMRLLPQFASNEAGARWTFAVRLPEGAEIESHPAQAQFSRLLLDAHRGYLQALARRLRFAQPVNVPAVIMDVSVEERCRLDRVHHNSDWVVTLDRFLGVEFYDNPRDPHLHGVARKYLLDYAPEYLEGLGHRMLVTTAHREEVGEVLGRAMEELGLRAVEESVSEVLQCLKTISGRLALRALGDDGRAREAVGLGAVGAYLKDQHELDDAILVPIDAHPELFDPPGLEGAHAKRAQRCDLLRIRFLPRRLEATFIEVKSRTAGGTMDELCQRIADQIAGTEKLFRDLFFRRERLDHVLQRSRLAGVLRFYLQRAWRYGLISSEEKRAELEQAVTMLERRPLDLRVLRWGFVVNLFGLPQRSRTIRDTEFRFLTAQDFAAIGLGTRKSPGPGPGGSTPTGRSESRIGSPPRPSQSPQAATAQPASDHRSSPPSGDSTDSGRMVVDALGSSRAGTETLVAAVGEASPQTAVAQSQALTDGDTQLLRQRRPLPEEVCVELGETVDDGQPVQWAASVRGSPHLFVLGIPGQGKSWTVMRLLCELADQGLPALSIDFHGQFADVTKPYRQHARPHVLDAARGLPFSPFEAESAADAGANYWMTNAFAVAEIFQYVCQLGDIQRDVVYEALRDCYLELGFDTGQAQRPPTVAEFARRLQQLEEQRGVRNVLPRCRPLLEFGLFQTAERVDVTLDELLREGVVLDVHNLALETLQLAAGAFVLRKIYKDMFRWGESGRLRLAIVLDEAHRLARDITLPKVMKEGRKFGLAVVVASQGLADYHPDVVGNAGTKVVFRTNFPMSKKVAGFLRGHQRADLAAVIEQLDVGEAMVQTPTMARCARVRMRPLATR